MESNIPEYVIADGSEGLRDVLESMRLKAEADADFRMNAHYVMYRLNAQQSLIKIDMSEQPFKFWYCDTLGRPATQIVKNTIADFLWESCGEKERYGKHSGSESTSLKEQWRREWFDKECFVDLFSVSQMVDVTQGKRTMIAVDDPLQQTVHKLAACQRQSPFVLLAAREKSFVGSGFGLYPGKTAASQQEGQEEKHQPTNSKNQSL